MEDEDYQYTKIDIKRESKKKDDYLAWEMVYDAFLLSFGLGKDYERIMALRIEIAEAECDMVIEDNNFLRNKIKMLRRELEELMEKPVENDLDSCLIHLSKWMGYKIDEKTTTYWEFNKMLREYQKEIERLNKAS